MKAIHEKEDVSISDRNTSGKVIEYWQYFMPIVLIYVLIVIFYQIVAFSVSNEFVGEFCSPVLWGWFTLFYILVAVPSILIFTMIAPSTASPNKLSSLCVYFLYFILFDGLFIFALNVYYPAPSLIQMNWLVFWMGVGYVALPMILKHVNKSSNESYKPRNPIHINQLLTVLIVGVFITSFIIVTNSPLGPKDDLYGKWIAYECTEPTPNDDPSFGIEDHVLSGYIQFNDDGTGRILTTAYNLPRGDFTWNSNSYIISEGSFSADELEIHMIIKQTTHTYSCWIQQHYPPTISIMDLEGHSTYYFEYEM